MKKADPPPRLNLLGYSGILWTGRSGFRCVGLSVPRSRLKAEVGNHAGMFSSFATRSPITNISDAIVRGPLQSNRDEPCCRSDLVHHYPVDPKPPAPRAVSSSSVAQSASGVMICSTINWQILLPPGSLMTSSLVL